MNTPDNNLRKAAVLLASLDADTADALIEQMPEDQAQLVRQALLSLEHLDPAEQETVIDEFFRIGPMPTPFHEEPSHEGVELDASLARRLSLDEEELPNVSYGNQPQPASLPTEPPSFEFLQSTDTRTLLELLRAEHPQTIAVVLANLPPETSGRVLADLSPNVQTDVVRRMVELRETDPQIVQEIVQGLQARMPWTKPGTAHAGGIGLVADILRTTGGPLERDILNNLNAQDPELASQLRRPELSFEHLEQRGPTVMARVVRASTPEVALLALADSRPDLVSAVLAQLPNGEARWLQHGLDHMPPTRLSDVEQAKRQLVQLAEDMQLVRNPADKRPASFAGISSTPASPWHEMSTEAQR